MISSGIKEMLILIFSLLGGLFVAFLLWEQLTFVWLQSFYGRTAFYNELIVTTLGLIGGLLVVSRFIPWLRTGRAATLLGIGWFFGILMAFTVIYNWIDASPLLQTVFSIIHLPAMGFAWFWDRFHLPHSGGDVGWWLVWCSPLVQWVMVSLGVIAWQHGSH